MSNWEKIAAQKRQETFALIPQEWLIENPPSREEQPNVTGSYIHQFLNKPEIEITETDAVGILANTTSGKWTAVDVTKAFCHRAALAHQLTNCLLEIFFVQALGRAKQLDDYFAKHQKPIGPLHGLPISLKDQFHVKNVETSMGYVGWIGTFQGRRGTGLEKNFESLLTQELLNMGAVLFVKTSVPHTLMSPESINHISGYVWNPKNRLLSAGGSSGGEGALIGLRGSPLGFGSDIGGSVRIPSAFNGLFGLRPSSGRIPYEGVANSMDGQTSILSVLGPLTTSPASLILAFKSIMSQKPWLYDPLCLELPWRDNLAEETIDLLKSKVSIAVMWDDGQAHVYPPITRALSMVVEKLNKAGHETLAWKPPVSHVDLLSLAVEIFKIDGGSDMHQSWGLSGEPPVKQLEWLSTRQPEKTASEIAEINVRKRNVQKAYMDAWNNTASLTSTGRPFDAILSPVAQVPACVPNSYGPLQYTVWVNVVDYTSVVIPVTHADKTLDLPVANFTPYDEADLHRQELYDPEVYHGAPVSLQLIGRRLQEEKMLTLASYVSELLAISI